MESGLTTHQLSEELDQQRGARQRATGPNQVWSWDITYLTNTVRGIWPYLYLVIDVSFGAAKW